VLLTMLDLRWTVRVHRYLWVYTFTRKGAVTWQDPYNKMTGNGYWRIDGGTMTTRWTGSKTWEEWDVPINPEGATGTCHMAEGNYDLWAVAQNYHLQPGDVVYAGEPITKGNGTVATIVYADEIRTGGTVAWICRNPGAIKDGSKDGAYPGKHLNVKGVYGGFAIFPDEATGLAAVVRVLKRYGPVTILDAMKKYAGKGDGHNDPVAYARTLASGLGVKDSTTLDRVDLTRMAKLITGVETTIGGTTWPRTGQAAPGEIRERLKGGAP
jgi:hypothetical protein